MAFDETAEMDIQPGTALNRRIPNLQQVISVQSYSSFPWVAFKLAPMASILSEESALSSALQLAVLWGCFLGADK